MFPKYTIKIDQARIRRKVLEHHAKVERAMISRMQEAGERFIISARSKTPQQGSFNDQTGNLRGSIGYVILNVGEAIVQAFYQDKGDGTGATISKKFVRELAKNFPTGLVLIAVAGMDYAAAVESKGKDVISGSVPELKARLKTAFERIRQKSNKIQL